MHVITVETTPQKKSRKNWRRFWRKEREVTDEISVNSSLANERVRLSKVLLSVNFIDSPFSLTLLPVLHTVTSRARTRRQKAGGLLITSYATSAGARMIILADRWKRTMRKVSFK